MIQPEQLFLFNHMTLNLFNMQRHQSVWWCPGKRSTCSTHHLALSPQPSITLLSNPLSCTSSEVGPLPFPPLCIGGMWHATDPTHTHARTHSEGDIPPKGRLVRAMCRCAEQHFWRPHTQTVVLPLVLRWATSVMRVVMWWRRVKKSIL